MCRDKHHDLGCDRLIAELECVDRPRVRAQSFQFGARAKHQRLTGTDRCAHGLLPDGRAVVAHVAFHHQIHFCLHLRHAEGARKHAIVARNTTWFARGLNDSVARTLDRVGGTDFRARRRIAVHANHGNGIIIDELGKTSDLLSKLALIYQLDTHVAWRPLYAKSRVFTANRAAYFFPTAAVPEFLKSMAEFNRRVRFTRLYEQVDWEAAVLANGCQGIGDWRDRCSRNAAAANALVTHVYKLCHAHGFIFTRVFAALDASNDKRAQRRRMGYEVALASGLRKGELIALKVADLDVTRGGLVLHAEWTKNRQGGFQPLPRALVERLVLSVKGKAGTDPLLFVSCDASKSLKRDLDRANIPTYAPGGKIDFHALRTAYTTFLLESGADLKTVQTLARHSSSALTLNTYGRAREYKLAEAAEAAGKALLPAESANSVHRLSAGTETVFVTCETNSTLHSPYLIRPEGLEPPTSRFEAWRSIQLS